MAEDINKMCIKCTTVKEKRAFEMILLDAIREKMKEERKEASYTLQDMNRVLVKTRTTSLNLSRKILQHSNQDCTRVYVEKSDLLADIKDEVTKRQHIFYKSAIVYPDSLIKYNNHNYITAYLNELFLNVKSFPIFCVMNDDIAIAGVFENGETSCHILYNGKVQSYYDFEDTLKNNCMFTRIVNNYLKSVDCSYEVIKYVTGALKIHSDMLKIITRYKLSVLLDYANEKTEYDDILHISELLRSDEPLDRWPHDVYEIVTDFMTYDFIDEGKNDYIRQVIKQYFYDLKFLK